MKTFRKLAVAAGVIAAMGATTVSQAHSIWFAQRSNQLAIIYGVGADDLDIVKRLPKIKSVTAYDEDGKEVATQAAPNGPLVTVNIDNQPAIIAATMDNGVWSKTPDGKWHNKGKDEVPNFVVSEHTFKYAVHLRRLDVVPPVIPHHKLQIVPVGKQLPEAMGTPVTVRVLFDGKPVAGAKVLPDTVTDPDAAPLKTGPDGLVTVKLRNQGLNVLLAVFDSPPANPAKTIKDEHSATLSFVLPHLPE
jgi:nickel transport protein